MHARSIIHINIADFAVAVERSVDCRLRGRPVIVAPEGAVRATVYDMSDEAYQSGVRKQMALQRALRYCRDAIVLPPHPDRYERATARLFKHAMPYSPLIEMTDCRGHLFIDATGTSRLFGPPPDLAWRLRRAIRTDMGFDPIWSVAANKLVAKVATRMVKPTGEYIVAAGNEQTFLAPLSLDLIPGIEQRDLKKLQEFNLRRVAHVSQLSVNQLEVIFGKRCQGVYEAVRGIDLSPVATAGRQPPKISRRHLFGTDTNDVRQVEGALYTLIEQTGAELRRRRLATRHIQLTVDYSDGKRRIRHAAAQPATYDDFRLFAVAVAALRRIWTRRVRIRQLSLICDRLTYPPAQQNLFAEDDTSHQTRTNLIVALDEIRHRFGSNAIRTGRTLAA